ncbi:hypothetical protein J1P26_21790 [Neobacillus sp. MM2021_6]|uniref:hypothetical protein n=1 Tax=Bacillaceae TaxID=186817 RepID=UPI0014083782|nr:MULTISPECIES: hypothetical protein [Bacillaceae]MBO0962339.1 hypothetical protein [Neobacillus sp. MM2021_6]NHC20822.1 hypothetical protein [Bacillus sp. MM2020_4]
MEQKLNSLDIGPLGKVTMVEGGTLVVPRLNNLKLIKIAKFLGIDGMKLYEQYQGIIGSQELSDSEKFITILIELPEEKVVHLLSILLEIEDDQALSLDPVITLEVIELYVDQVNIEKAFMLVRSLAKKLFKVELPDLKSLFNKNRGIRTDSGESFLTNS